MLVCKYRDSGVSRLIYAFLYFPCWPTYAWVIDAITQCVIQVLTYATTASNTPNSYLASKLFAVYEIVFK